MSAHGSTFGGPGSPSLNLSLAQFQQRVATAENKCRKCTQVPNPKNFCRAYVQAKYFQCPEPSFMGCGEKCVDPCEAAAAAPADKVPKPCKGCVCEDEPSCDCDCEH